MRLDLSFESIAKVEPDVPKKLCKFTSWLAMHKGAIKIFRNVVTSVTLYFAITAFGLEALWLISLRKVSLKSHIASTSQHPLRSRCWEGILSIVQRILLLQAHVSVIYEQNIVLVPCIYLYICTTLIPFITQYLDCQSYQQLDKYVFERSFKTFAFTIFIIAIPANPADLITYQSSLYPRV